MSKPTQDAMHDAEENRREWDFSDLIERPKAEQLAAYTWEIDREGDRLEKRDLNPPWLSLDEDHRVCIIHSDRGLSNLAAASFASGTAPGRFLFSPTVTEATAFVGRYRSPNRLPLLAIDYGWIRYKSQLKGALKVIEKCLLTATGPLPDDPPMPRQRKRISHRERKRSLRAVGYTDAEIIALIGAEQTKPREPMVRLTYLSCYRLRTVFGLSHKAATRLLTTTRLKRTTILDNDERGASAFSNACAEAEQDIRHRQVSDAGLLRSFRLPLSALKIE